ncbi:hypothetical protein [Falsiroseomonas oryzae]|uniref:hypothetical protein n=1 Tax=Falsiroseomonas oryzae TaxID=2766473 RepID=UPI0022EA3312|nr:hypothetical protein [Roseomonas sp. MO-31]
MTSVTVVVPMSIRRRGGRKQIVGPDGAPVQTGGDSEGIAETRGDPALVKALARAFRWRRMLEEGRYGSIRELAAAEGVDRAYIGRVLNLTLLAPELVESIIEGRQAREVKLCGLLEITCSWPRPPRLEPLRFQGVRRWRMSCSASHASAGTPAGRSDSRVE